MNQLQEANEGRLMRLDRDDRLIAAFAVERNAQFLLASADGTLMHLRAANIPVTLDLQNPGTKIFPKRDLQTAILWQPNRPLWIVTTKRTHAQTFEGIPTGKLVLNKGETLVSLLSH
jgi:hypothetical protein